MGGKKFTMLHYLRVCLQREIWEETEAPTARQPPSIPSRKRKLICVQTEMTEAAVTLIAFSLSDPAHPTAIIHQRNMQIKRLQCKVKKLEAKRVTEDPRTDRLWRSNAQLRIKLAYLKEKTDQKPRLNQSADLSSLRDKVSYLENENATLSEYMEQLSNETISAKVDGKTYSDALRRAIYLCVCPILQSGPSVRWF